MLDADVIIVGGGLSGLRAALDVSRAGLSVLVVEAGTAVGGRMRTTPHNGFLLDHGFQVVLGGYPELRSVDGLSSLGLMPFDSGARVWRNGRFRELFHPFRHPSKALRALRSGIASPLDLVRLARYSRPRACAHPEPLHETTAESLLRYRFSALFRESFLAPFLSSILLDPLLGADAACARFYLRMFSGAPALLPRQGIQALPELLAQQVGVSHILLHSKAQSATNREVVLSSGERLMARKVIVAADSTASAHLGGPEQTMPQRSARTLYFSAPEPPYHDGVIALNGEKDGPLVSLAVVTNVQPSYAPPGRVLVAANLLGDSTRIPEAEAVSAVRRQLSAWFGSVVSSWEFLRGFAIAAAVPARPRMGAGACSHRGVIFSGDYLSYGSQNGALRAGRAAAQLALEELGSLSAA